MSSLQPTAAELAELRAMDLALTMRREAEAEAEEAEGPEMQPAGAGIAEGVAALLAKIKPATAEEVRASDWKNFVLPRLTASRIELRYRYEIRDWQCPPQRATFEECRRRFIGQGAIVALVGSRGVGKTAIAAQLIIGRAFEDVARMQEPNFLPRPTPYRKLSDLISRFKPLYADFGTTATEELTEARDALLSSSLMIIDECHDSSELKMRDRVLTDFLDRSYSRMHDVLLISNEKEQEFEASAGASVISRIREHGCIIPCFWKSWREGEARQLARHG